MRSSSLVGALETLNHYMQHSLTHGFVGPVAWSVNGITKFLLRVGIHVTVFENEICFTGVFALIYTLSEYASSLRSLNRTVTQEAMNEIKGHMLLTPLKALSTTFPAKVLGFAKVHSQYQTGKKLARFTMSTVLVTGVRLTWSVSTSDTSGMLTMALENRGLGSSGLTLSAYCLRKDIQ